MELFKEILMGVILGCGWLYISKTLFDYIYGKWK